MPLPIVEVAFNAEADILALAVGASPGILLLNILTMEFLPGIATFAGATTSVAFSNPAPRYLRGPVRDIDGNPAERRVRAYNRVTKQLAGETKSDPITGDYELALYGQSDTEYDIQFLANDGELLNDLFFARATTSET